MNKNLKKFFLARLVAMLIPIIFFIIMGLLYYADQIVAMYFLLLVLIASFLILSLLLITGRYQTFFSPFWKNVFILDHIERKYYIIWGAFLFIISALLFITLIKMGFENMAKSNNAPTCNNQELITFETPKNEILSAEIDSSGGILQATDNNGQWIIVTIPPGAIKQKTKINLNLKESNYKINSGLKSPLSFSITPDIAFDQPIKATILYDKKYSCDKISVVIPYFIDQNNSLSPAQLIGLYKNQNILMMDTFHGGTYSWVYSK